MTTLREQLADQYAATHPNTMIQGRRYIADQYHAYDQDKLHAFKAGWDACEDRYKPLLSKLNFVISKGMITITDHHDRNAWEALKRELDSLDGR